MNTLSRYLDPDDIRLDLAALDRQSLLDAIGRHMEQHHGLPAGSVAAGLTRRELAISTGLGQGVAIPHCRVTGLDRILAAYFRVAEPIPFNAPDGAPVGEFLVLLVPREADQEHLNILADAAGMFSDASLRTRLRAAAEPRAVKCLFDDWNPVGA